MIKYIFLLCCLLLTFSCSSLLKYEKTKEEFKTDEFDKKVQIVEVVEEVKESHEPEKTIKNESSLKQPVISKISKAKLKTLNSEQKKKTSKRTNKRLPEIEDSEGFANQRRPLVDPFRVGERVTHEVSYLGATAGHLSFIVKPFAIVNGRKNYNFFIDLKSNSFFSRVFAVDDQVQTYMDFEEMVSGAYKLDIRDSAQVKEARAYYDFESLKANYWEHKYTEKSGHEEKKLNWDILPYSQNPYSAIFYMRVFNWSLGKECQFRVADDEKNIIFKAKAIEKTVLETAVGTFNAIKLKAEVTTRGNLSKARDLYIWISDDERKYILRIEVDLPVGSLVSTIVELKQGNLE